MLDHWILQLGALAALGCWLAGGGPQPAAVGEASDLRSLVLVLHERVEAGERLSVIERLESALLASPNDELAAAFLSGVLRGVAECAAERSSADERAGCALDGEGKERFWELYFELLAASEGPLAVDAVERAERLAPDDREVLWRLAHALRLSEPARSAPLYRRLAQRTAADARQLGFHLEAVWSLGDFAAVIADATRIIDANKDALAARLLRAAARFESGASEAADSDMDFVTAHAPRDPAPERIRAALSLLHDQPEAALEHLSISLTIDPSSAAALWLRIGLRWGRGDFEGALVDLEQLITDGNDDPVVVAARDVLQSWKATPGAAPPPVPGDLTPTSRQIHSLLGTSVTTEDDRFLQRRLSFPITLQSREWQSYLLTTVERARAEWPAASAANSLPEGGSRLDGLLADVAQLLRTRQFEEARSQLEAALAFAPPDAGTELANAGLLRIPITLQSRQWQSCLLTMVEGARAQWTAATAADGLPGRGSQRDWLLARIAELLLSGQTEEARSRLDAALAFAPANARAEFARAGLWAASGRIALRRAEELDAAPHRDAQAWQFTAELAGGMICGVGFHRPALAQRHLAAALADALAEPPRDFESLVVLAEESHLAGDDATAIAASRAVVARTPKDADERVQWRAACLTSRELKPFLAELEHRLAADHKDPDALLDAARYYKCTAFTSGMRDYLARLFALRPDCAEGWALLGWSKQHDTSGVEIIDRYVVDFDHAVKLAPYDLKLLRQRADAWEELRTTVDAGSKQARLADGVALLRDLADLRSRGGLDESSWEWYARVLVEQERDADAVAEYTTCLEADVGSADDRALLLNARARCRLRLGERDPAERDLRVALALADRAAYHLELVEESWDELVAIRRGVTKAAVQYERVRARVPLDAIDFEYQTDILLGRAEDRDWREARSLCDRWLEAVPTSVRVYRKRALAFEKLGLRDKALADLDHCLELDPQDTDARRSRIRNRQVERLSKGVMADCAVLLGRDPNDEFALEARALQNRRDHKLNAAIADYEKLRGLRPADNTVESNLFNTLAEQFSSRSATGNWAAADQVLAHLLELEPGNIDATKQRGKIALFAGNPEKARQWRAMALGLDPSWEGFAIEGDPAPGDATPEDSSPTLTAAPEYRKCPDCLGIGNWSTSGQFVTDWRSTYTSVVDHSNGNVTRVPIGEQSSQRWVAGSSNSCRRCNGTGWVEK